MLLVVTAHQQENRFRKDGTKMGVLNLPCDKGRDFEACEEEMCRDCSGGWLT